MTDAEAFKQLVESEGYEDELEFLKHCVSDSVNMGICVECGYTCEVEPDQDQGWCDECGQNTVKAPLVLRGMI